MLHQFSITISDVINVVDMTTAYEASKRISQDPEAYKRMATTSADAALLTSLIANAAATIVSRFADINACSSTAGNLLTISFDLSEAHPTALIPEILTQIQNFLFFHSTGQWYEISSKSDAEATYAKASASLDSIERLIYTRRPPINH